MCAVDPTGAYVLNELAARELGWTPEQAIGKRFELDLSADFSFAVRGPVIGVVKNTYVGSVRDARRPIAYFASPEAFAWDSRPFFFDASVRVTGENLPATLDFIDTAWKELVPEQPLAREFLDARWSRSRSRGSRSPRSRHGPPTPSRSRPCATSDAALQRR